MAHSRVPSRLVPNAQRPIDLSTDELMEAAQPYRRHSLIDLSTDELLDAAQPVAHTRTRTRALNRTRTLNRARTRPYMPLDAQFSSSGFTITPVSTRIANDNLEPVPSSSDNVQSRPMSALSTMTTAAIVNIALTSSAGSMSCEERFKVENSSTEVLLSD